ncbi:MAG: PaaI family thioesterase [Bdellovibrio sp.]|nr:MAG: PaaI family thioesterase [Bdellovibrio sp.]
MEKSLQDTYAPHSICFGCGPSNSKGLQIKSFPTPKNPDLVTATWTPSPHHEAFPGMLNGGIIGSLLDCHSNWTAAYTLMRHQQLKSPPCTVTARYTINLLRPTPSHQNCYLEARPQKVDSDRVLVEAKLFSGEKLCATCEGLFVAIKEGHPAYHRWG